MFTAEPQSDRVATRLLDYFARRAPWQRRLWNPGSLLAIAEVVEAIEACRDGAIKEAALRDLAAATESKVGRDPGLGSDDLRRHLQACLRNPKATSHVAEQLRYIGAASEAAYLGNWAAAVGDEVEPEFASRALGAHLLDSGYSPEQLHRWVTALKHDHQDFGVGELIALAQELIDRPERDYEVFIPMRSMPGPLPGATDEWLSPDAARAWLTAQVGDPRGVRHNGGFLFHVGGFRDPWAAVEHASDLIESMQARVIVAYPGRVSFQPLDKAWVGGRQEPIRLDRPRRQVDIVSLKRSERVYATDALISVQLRSALDLLAPLEIAAPGAAISGGWAAIEALLSESAEPNVAAADHLAALVACSYPRAELTTLAYRYAAENDDSLADRMRGCATNLERADALAMHLQASPIDLADRSDRAAAARMQELLNNPRPILSRVRAYATEAFRRLYRQRNLVLHHGNFESIAMVATLRTAPPLVGAGIDRIVHASLDAQSKDPRALVAQAEVELSLVSATDPSALVRMLEPR